jgi:hypothetical protein
MSELLFEDFWLLLLVAFIVSGGLIYWAYQRRTRKLILMAKIVPALFAFLLGLNLWVITEREALRARLDQLVEACEKGETNEIGAMLDEQFTAQGLTGEDLIHQLKDVFNRLKFPRVILLEVENRPPVVNLSTAVDVVSTTGHDYGRVFSSWELTFIKRSTGWYLYELKPVNVQFKPMTNIREVIDSARWVN